jgi:hypothetical protein
MYLFLLGAWWSGVLCFFASVCALLAFRTDYMRSNIIRGCMLGSFGFIVELVGAAADTVGGFLFESFTTCIDLHTLTVYGSNSTFDVIGLDNCYMQRYNTSIYDKRYKPNLDCSCIMNYNKCYYYALDKGSCSTIISRYTPNLRVYFYPCTYFPSP